MRLPSPLPKPDVEGPMGSQKRYCFQPDTVESVQNINNIRIRMNRTGVTAVVWRERLDSVLLLSGWIMAEKRNGRKFPTKNCDIIC